MRKAQTYPLDELPPSEEGSLVSENGGGGGSGLSRFVFISIRTWSWATTGGGGDVALDGDPTLILERLSTVESSLSSFSKAPSRSL